MDDALRRRVRAREERRVRARTWRRRLAVLPLVAAVACLFLLDWPLSLVAAMPLAAMGMFFLAYNRT